MRAEIAGCHFSQRAPAAANFQNALPGTGLHFRERAAHFGVLCLCGASRQIAAEQGAGVVHGLVQPQGIETVAQVVMGVDIFLAVAARVALEQVLDAVERHAPPTAKNGPVYHRAVADQQAQQIGQVGAGPVACDIAFGKANVARLQGGRQGFPVVQRQGGMWLVLLPEALYRAIRQLDGEAADFQAAQQSENSTRRSGHGCRHGLCSGIGGVAAHGEDSKFQKKPRW